MNIKTEVERRAKILGFNCYYNIETGAMRSQGGNLKDWCFTLVLLVNYLYRLLVLKLFFVRLSLSVVILPDKNEKINNIYAELIDLINDSIHYNNISIIMSGCI